MAKKTVNIGGDIHKSAKIEASSEGITINAWIEAKLRRALKIAKPQKREEKA